MPNGAIGRTAARPPTCRRSTPRPKKHMTRPIYPYFVEACTASFSRLVKEFSFQPAVIRQIGRECFIKYIKGNHIVSVAYELGSLPIVELFYPSIETGESPTPWAERNGVPYTRRIPRLNVVGKYGENKEDLRRYLEKCVAELISKEKSFLT